MAVLQSAFALDRAAHFHAGQPDTPAKARGRNVSGRWIFPGSREKCNTLGGDAMSLAGGTEFIVAQHGPVSTVSVDRATFAHARPDQRTHACREPAYTR